MVPGKLRRKQAVKIKKGQASQKVTTSELPIELVNASQHLT